MPARRSLNRGVGLCRSGRLHTGARLRALRPILRGGAPLGPRMGGTAVRFGRIVYEGSYMPPMWMADKGGVT